MEISLLSSDTLCRNTRCILILQNSFSIEDNVNKQIAVFHHPEKRKAIVLLFYFLFYFIFCIIIIIILFVLCHRQHMVMCLLFHLLLSTSIYWSFCRWLYIESNIVDI